MRMTKGGFKVKRASNRFFLNREGSSIARKAKCRCLTMLTEKEPQFPVGGDVSVGNMR